MELLAPDVSRIAPEGGEASKDRAPDELASGTPEPLRSELIELLGAGSRADPGDRPGPLRLRRESLPAAAEGGRDGSGRQMTSRRSSPTPAPRRSRSPSAPEAPASTGSRKATGSSSTSGATGPGWRCWTTAPARASSPAPSSATPTGCSGRTGASSARIPPAPTSPASAACSPTTRAGCAAAIVADSYSTVRSLTFVLPSGTVIDTAAPDAAERFAAGRAGAGEGPRRDPGRDPRRRGAHRADPEEVPDQEHHRLPALRVPRRRRAGRDLPPPADRLRGDARLHRRGGLRDGAEAIPHHGLLAALRRDRVRHRAGAGAGRGRAQARSS